jgi:predicted aspartyl protease
MEDLQDFLKGKKYKKIPFKVLKTQHLLIKGTINGVKGNFILDTGASNSCMGFESVDRFLLNAKFSETKAAGAGAVGMETQLAKNNEIQLGRWKKKFHLIVFDMRHVNEALIQYKTKPVDGIIGADVLLKGKAIIDYSNHYLYLK